MRRRLPALRRPTIELRPVSPARLLTGVGVLLAAGAVVAAGGLAPAASWAPSAGQDVELASGDAVLVCAAPPRLQVPAGEDPVTDEDFDAVADTRTGIAAVATGAQVPPGLALTEDGDITEGRPAGSLVSARGEGSAAATAVAVPGEGQPARLAAVQTALTAEGDLRGLSASGCAAPAEDAWLVGGSTVVGHSTRLELVNPGATTATVDLTVLTPDGPLRPQAGQGIALAAGGGEEILLEGLVPDATALAVRVSSAGGRVAASLVESRLDGLTPRGVETVVAGSAPAEQQTVPGVVLRDDGAAPQLRVAVPGEENAVVRWQVSGPDGPVAPSGATAGTVPAGTVADLPLDGLAPGAYTVTVDADVPVAVAVRSGSAADGQEADVAWSSSATALTGSPVVALPRDGDVATHLLLSAAAEGGEVDVQALADDGSVAGTRRLEVGRAVQEVDVTALAPDGAVALVVSVQPAAAQDGDVAVHGALVLTAPAGSGAELLSVVGVRPDAQAPGAVTVRPARDGRWP